MAEKDLRKWTTFFHEAGVPRGPAMEYATLFCDHRIKDVLLGDLTKEILNDIGITVMGDIMSILKYAKAVYAKLEREKSSNRLIQDSEPADEVTKENPPIQSTSQVKKKKIVLKPKPKAELVQERETLKITTTTKKKPPVSEPKITVTVDDSAIVPKKRPAKSTLSLSERFAKEMTAQAPPKVSRISVEETEVKPSTVKSVLKKQSTKVSTPSDKGVSAVKRKSAFERLGKEDSSASVKPMDQLFPKIKITKMTKSPVKAPSSKVISLTKNESSVFKRLGETDAQSPASNTSTGALTIRTVRGLGSRIVSDDVTEKPVKSLPPLKPIRAVQPVKPVSSVKARVSVDSTKESSRKSVFSRLGSQT